MILPRLGKLPPHHHDHPHRRLKLASFLEPTLPDPPERADWSGPVGGWGLYRNHEIGDCTVVAPANAIRVWTATTGVQCDLPEVAVLEAYTVFSGFYPGPPVMNDDGCVLSDVLAGWSTRDVGIGGNVLTCFAEVAHTNARAIRQTIAIFGVCILGVELPRAAQDQLDWLDVPHPADDPLGYDRSGAWEPGSWGGHCVVAVAYTETELLVVSWGRLLRVSWRWLAAYCSEAWAAVSCDWLLRDGRSPSGLDLDGLLAARAALARREP